jgi:hypothetical protein
MTLLLLTARTTISPQQQTRISAIARTDLDWDRLVALSESHKLHLLLHQALSKVCPDVVPEAVMARLRSQFQVNTIYVLQRISELVKLTEFFSAQGIPAIGLKGPILAAQAYQSISLRSVGDLDFLVQPQDFKKLQLVLQAQGYELPNLGYLSVQPEEQQRFFWTAGQYPLVNPQKNIFLDIHWKLLSQDTLTQHLDYDYFCDRFVSIDLAGKSVLTLAPADALLHLCLHGAKDFWISLRSVCDIAELVQHHSDLNWEALLQAADQLGAERTVCLGLHLAQRLFDLPLPEIVQQRIEEDAQVRSLCLRISRRLCCNLSGVQKVSLFEKLALQLAFIEGWQRKFLYCSQGLLRTLRLFFRINHSDQAFLALPRPLHSLYYFLRPIRLVRDHGFGVFRMMF